MELDDSAVEREKLVNDDLDDELPCPATVQPQTIPSTTAPNVGKMSKSSTGSIKLNRSGSAGTGRAEPERTMVAATSAYREPVVIVSNTMQKAAPETVVSSSVPTPVSPGLNNHRGVFSMTTSGDTSRSQNSTKSHRNSTTGSGTIIGSGTGGSGAPLSTRLVFVNERTGSAHSSTGAGGAGKSNPTPPASSDKNIKARKIQRDPATLPPRPPVPTTLNHSKSVSSTGLSFSDRALKHHSFMSEVPDVRHMERALLGLLDDFHSGKLRAFGSSGTMEQMTNIREQQERLAKLHFELGGAVHNMMMSEEDNAGGAGGGGGFDNENETIAQENMKRLVKQLEQLSVSIEGLQGNSDAL